MSNRIKAISGLSCCKLGEDGYSDCADCPYCGEGGCSQKLIEDALEALEALEAPQNVARLLTLEEAEDRLNDAIWIEQRGLRPTDYRMLGSVESYSRRYHFLYVLHIGKAAPTPYPYCRFGTDWRAWSRQPTEAQMKEAPWAR